MLARAAGTELHHRRAPAAALVGAQAPEFTLKAANDGRDISLSDYRGRPVVLVFLRGFG